MTGKIIIGLEVELGWGLVQYDMLDALSERRQQETETLNRLLDLCEQVDVALTFNIVGQLFLSELTGTTGGGHPDGWFDDIPPSGPGTAPEFYAPDLVEMIDDSQMNHELATHTFTHIRCAEVSPETVRWELDQVSDVHEEQTGKHPQSFVPPNHSLPPYEILQEAGMQVVRVPFRHANNINQPTSKSQRALQIILGSEPASEPRVNDGLIETYVSEHISLASPLLPSGQRPPHPVFRSLPKSLRRWLHRRSLRRALSAARTGKTTHLWAHLWDIANDQQWPQIEWFLREVAKSAQSGEISVVTMGRAGANLQEQPRKDHTN